MRGLVFTEFLELVESEFGIEVVDKICSNPDLCHHGAYTSVGNYPHHDMLKMLGDLSTTVGIEARDLTYAFGKYLFIRFSKLFPDFLEGHDDPLVFLEGIEAIIHSEVRKLYPDAHTPSFQCHWANERELHMQYGSSRPMADLAEGLIAGCIDYFAKPVSVRRLPGPTGDIHSAKFILQRQ